MITTMQLVTGVVCKDLYQVQKINVSYTWYKPLVVCHHWWW